MPYLIIILLAAALIYFLPKYFRLTNNFASQLSTYKATELQKELEKYNLAAHDEIEKRMAQNAEAAKQQALTMVAEWQVKYEEATRQDAINKSQSIMMGKTLEHLIPFFPEFKWNPRDARFLGSPVDLIVFDGLSEGHLRQIVFVEIKTNISQLNAREVQIRDIIKSGRVTWEEIRHFINAGIVKP
jgi:predicted Holliday junction resolvase-like endonuclease